MEYYNLNLRKLALITIDTQCDTLDGEPLEIQGTSAVLPNMRKILDVFRELKLPVIHIVRIYLQDGSNAELCRKRDLEEGKKMLIKNSKGSQIAREILNEEVILNSEKLLQGEIQSISEHEVVIFKPRWGAFYKTPLEEYLKRLQIDSLLFSGCNYPNCPRTSIYEASERDYKTGLLTDGISGLYEKGEKEMRNIGVNLYSTSEMIARLENEYAYNNS